MLNERGKSLSKECVCFDGVQHVVMHIPNYKGALATKMKNNLIIKYIMETYSPEAIIVYGSYADGSANENSDFDALVITDSVKKA